MRCRHLSICSASRSFTGFTGFTIGLRMRARHLSILLNICPLRLLMLLPASKSSSSLFILPALAQKSVLVPKSCDLREFQQKFLNVFRWARAHRPRLIPPSNTALWARENEGDTSVTAARTPACFQFHPLTNPAHALYWCICLAHACIGAVAIPFYYSKQRAHSQALGQSNHKAPRSSM